MNLWWGSNTEKLGYTRKGLDLELHSLPTHSICCGILKSVHGWVLAQALFPFGEKHPNHHSCRSPSNHHHPLKYQSDTRLSHLPKGYQYTVSCNYRVVESTVLKIILPWQRTGEMARSILSSLWNLLTRSCPCKSSVSKRLFFASPSFLPHSPFLLGVGVQAGHGGSHL